MGGRITSLEQYAHRVREVFSLQRGFKRKATYVASGVKKKVFAGSTRKITQRKQAIFTALADNPVLTMGEVCALLEIRLPDSYRGCGDMLVHATPFFAELNSRHPWLSELGQGDYFGEEFWANLPFNVNRFKKHYDSLVVVSHTHRELVEYFIEWLYVFKPLGYYYDDYFGYELYAKSVSEAQLFISQSDRRRYGRVARDRAYHEVFKNKALFHQQFPDLVSRQYLDTTTSSWEEFATFVAEYPRYFAKPLRGSVGRGARVMTTRTSTKSMWKKCQRHQLVLEEIIDQHPSLAQFNDSTLNTLRLYTLLPAEGGPILTLAGIRFGRKGAIVDNFHHGGIAAGINPVTGIVETGGIDRSHMRYEHHPDAGTAIPGFHVPYWDEIVATVLTAAGQMPHIRSIGWDVAITADGTIECVEGNDRPDFDVTQIVDQVGKKHLYEPHMAALETLGIDNFGAGHTNSS